MTGATVHKYNKVQALFHWVSAVLIICLLITGAVFLTDIPNSDPEKVSALKWHLLTGILILMLAVFRIIWRMKTAQPVRLTTNNTVLDYIAEISHLALSMLVILVALSGIGVAMHNDLPSIVFLDGGFLPQDFWEHPSRLVHGVLTRILMFMIVIHSMGALYHQFIIKDNPFKRISVLY